MIINYCSGGIGNRIKPFGSCYLLSKKLNTQLGMVWKPTMRCGARFNSLFKNNIPNIDLNSLDSSNTIICSDPSYIYHDYNLNGDRSLLNLYEKIGSCTPLNGFSSISTNKNVVVYNNTWFGGFSDISDFVNGLIPVDVISHKVKTIIDLLQLNKNVIGVHLRGTDFNIPVNYYDSALLDLDKDRKVFVCSDDKQLEIRAMNLLGNRGLRYDKNYVYKNNETIGWSNNVKTTEESVIDSIIDMYLLSKTDIKIYNNNSTFAHVALLLNPTF